MASHLHKGSFGLSFALSIACTISILLLSAVTISAQTFSPTGSMSISRYDPTSTQLLNGKVLVAGGSDANTDFASDTAELYNSATGTFTATGSMVTARGAHTATLLTNGEVLIAGGSNNNEPPPQETTTTAELYNPSTGTFTSTGSMTVPRQEHAATLLCSGKVLITGGDTVPAAESSSAEIYDPATGAFTATGSMVNRRSGHTATLLPNCKVLIAGGIGNPETFGPSIATAELYDPSTGTFTATGSMTTGRAFGHTATLLFDGRVLVAGGLDPNADATDTAEIYDPSSGTFSSAGNMKTNRRNHIAALLANGRVLVAGGLESTSNGPEPLTLAELFHPSTNSFTETGSMSDERALFVASLLSDGLVLVTGGTGDQTAELYTPATMPAAKIMSPINNSVVQNTVIISTAVSSQVLWINLYVDGNYITSSPPYNFTWDSTTIANGSHTISIKAFNYSSGSRTQVGSNSITVNVENGAIASTPTAAATPTPTPLAPTPTPTPVIATPTPTPIAPTATPTPTSGAVTITSPANGATVSGTVSIVTTKSSKVQWENIYIDGNYLASSPPTTFSWNSTRVVSNGNHTITAKGFNSSDQVVGKASVTVNVQN